MRIKSVHIKNLRAIADATIDLEDYCCFVGANGAGKSTVLFGLNVFFRDVDAQGVPITNLAEEDFHNRNTAEPIEITVRFDSLSIEAQQEFKDYFRQDELVVTARAVFDEAKGCAEIRHFGQRLGMVAFADFFRLLGDKARVDELRKAYAPLAAEFGLPAHGTANAMQEALRQFEAGHPELCSLLPSEDQFYGASKGQGKLQRHVQWVYVPAVKDASAEQSEGKATALGKLLARTVRAKVNFADELGALAADTRHRYRKLLDDSQQALTDISAALNEKLAQWAHPDASLRLQWHQDGERSVRIEDPFARVVVGEGAFEGGLARFGNGLQRSYLLALLQELASGDAEGGPKLILGCEEPELYQHPPQARHMAGVLQQLAQTGSQVLLSTHSPLFISGESFRNVRLVRKDSETKVATVRGPELEVISQQIAAALGKAPVKDAATLSKISQLLQPQLSEMFFTQRLVLVEGIEDCAYIQAWLSLTDRLAAWRARGLHLVPVGGKSELLRPAVIAANLAIPTFVIFDGDGDKIETDAKKSAHERDNRSLLRILGGDESVLFPAAPVWSASYAMWPNDLADCVDDDLVATLGKAKFEQTLDKARDRCGNPGGGSKHSMLIGAKLAYGFDEGGRSETLDRLCESLLTF